MSLIMINLQFTDQHIYIPKSGLRGILNILKQFPTADGGFHCSTGWEQGLELLSVWSSRDKSSRSGSKANAQQLPYVSYHRPHGKNSLSPFSHFICVYCSLRSSQTDTPHCNLTARTQTVHTPCYRIQIKHTLSQHIEVSVNTAQSRTVVGKINHTHCICISEVSHR